MLTSTSSLEPCPVGHRLIYWHQQVASSTPRLFPKSFKTFSSKFSSHHWKSSLQNHPRGLILRAHSKDGTFSDTSKLSASMARLLDAVDDTNPSRRDPKEVRKLGKEVEKSMQSLKSQLKSKSSELAKVTMELDKTSGELGEACLLLAACQEELEITTSAVESLKEDLQVAQRGREDDNKSTLAKYRELEEALALAQDELEKKSLNNYSSASTKVLAQLQVVVKNQDQVLEDLLASLDNAQSAKNVAEQRVSEAERETLEKQSIIVELQARQNVLEGVVKDTRAALEKSEELWKVEKEEYKSQEIELKDKLLVAARKLDEKASEAKVIRTSLEVLQFQFHQKAHLADTLEQKCNALQIASDIMAREGGGEAPQGVEVHIQRVKLDEDIATLKSKLNEMAQRDQVWSEKTSSLSQDLELKDKELTELEQHLHGLQVQLQQKTDELNKSEENNLSLTLHAQQMGKQVTELESQVAKLNSSLDSKSKTIANMLARVEVDQLIENDDKVVIAQLQRDLERTLVMVALKSSNSNDLDNNVSELQVQLLKQTKTYAKKQEENKAVIAKLRDLLIKAENNHISPGFSPQLRTIGIHNLDEQREFLGGDPSQLSAENSQLLSKVASLQAELEKSHSIQESLKHQLENVRESRQRACRDLKEIKSGVNTDNVHNGCDQIRTETVEAHLPNSELGESDSIVLELRHQLESLQAQLEEKNAQFEKLESALTIEKSHALKVSKALNKDIENLTKALREQRNSNATVAKGKAAAERKVQEMEDLLNTGLAEVENNGFGNVQNTAVQQTTQVHSESMLTELRRIAAEELEATAKLLEKAEQVALATRESMKVSRGTEIGNATVREREYQNELEVQVSTLKTLLEQQSLAASEATHRSEVLETEVMELSCKLTQIQKTNHMLQNLPQDMDESSPQLPASMRSKEPEMGQFQELRGQLRKLEPASCGAIESWESAASDELLVCKARIDALEEENARLKKLAARRNKILTQSKKFIEHYLDPSIAPSSSEEQ